ncbi:hypothetical protein GCM10027098_15600 [Bowmanella dokdonensis]
MKESYPYWDEERLKYKFKCLTCGTYVKRGTRKCYKCNSWFSQADVEEMIQYYKENKRKNWHHIFYFVLITSSILALWIGAWL